MYLKLKYNNYLHLHYDEFGIMEMAKHFFEIESIWKCATITKMIATTAFAVVKRSTCTYP